MKSRRRVNSAVRYLLKLTAWVRELQESIIVGTSGSTVIGRECLITAYIAKRILVHSNGLPSPQESREAMPMNADELRRLSQQAADRKKQESLDAARKDAE